MFYRKRRRGIARSRRTGWENIYPRSRASGGNRGGSIMGLVLFQSNTFTIFPLTFTSYSSDLLTIILIDFIIQIAGSRFLNRFLNLKNPHSERVRSLAQGLWFLLLVVIFGDGIWDGRDHRHSSRIVHCRDDCRAVEGPAVSLFA